MRVLIVAKTVIFRQDSKTLILRRSHESKYRPDELDVAGGLVEDGENYVMAAIREVYEETGLSFKPNELNLVFADSGLRNQAPAVWLFFVAFSNQSQVKISPEHSSFEWMNLEQAIIEMEDGRQKRLLKFIHDNSLNADSLPQS